MAPFLARPSEIYKDSYIEALHELQAEGRSLNLDVEQIAADFGSYVQNLLDKEDKEKCKPELVPETMYWLVEGDEFIGVSSVRHELNENLFRIGGNIGYGIRPSKRMQGYGKLILKLTLENAGEIGLEKVLVTCDSDNIGSKKIIEANGGILENEVEVEVDGRLTRKLRYWIAL